MAMTATEILLTLRAVDNASSVIKQVESSSNSLGASFTRVGQNALGVAAGIAAAAAASGVFNALGGIVVGFNAKLETSAASWKTFTGSAEAAQAVMVQIQQIAATTPFEFEDVDKAAKRFVNAGMTAQGALDYVIPLANAVASVGLGAVGVDRVSLALSQMTQKGKVSGQEMLQLTEAQIPAWEILAQATGKPIPELQKLVEQGKITATEYTNAFATFYGATGKFANAAKDQSLTFAGSMSTIRDQVNIVGSTAFQPIFKVLSDLARSFAAFVQSEQFTIWGAKIQAVVGFVVDGLGALYGAFASSLGGVLDVVSTVGQAIYGALQWINPFAAHSEPLVSQVEDGVAAIKTAYGSLDTVTGTFDSVRSAFENLSGVTAQFTGEFGDDLPTKVEKALAIMGPGVVEAFRQASDAVDIARTSVAEIKDQWDLATAALAPLKDALDDAKDGLKDQQATLGDLKSNLSDAKAAYDPLNEELKAVQQNAKDAEQAIKDLTNAPLAGSADFDKKISAGNIGLKEQELALSRLKHSDTYASLGTQIEAATSKIKEMQRAQTLQAGPTSDSARAAIVAQQVALDVLKDKQQGLLEPAQKELDKRRDLLDTLRLEKDATIGVAQERLKAAAAGALGIKEQTEAQVAAAIEAAKIARDSALAKEAVLSPQVKVQEDAIRRIEGAIRAQDKAVSDAQKTADAANDTYSDAKKLVDDLGTAYRSGKSEIAGYDQQLKQLLQTGDLQVQKAKEAKKAADDLAKKGAGGPGAPKADVLAGLDIEGSKAKIKAFQDQVATTRANLTGHLDAIAGKWATVWGAVSGAIDRVLARFGGFAAMQPALDFLKRFATAGAALVLGLAGAGAIIGGFLAALAPFAPALALILTPIGLLVLGVGALAAAWSLNIGNIQQSAAGLGEAFSPLRELPAIVEKAFGGDVTGALEDFVGVLQSVRTRVVETLAAWGAAFVDWLLPQLPTLTTQLTTFASAIIGWILAQGDKYLTSLLKWGSAFVDWIAPRIPAILTALSTMGSQILQWIRDQGTIIANRLGEWAARFIQWVIPLLPQLGTALKQIATAVIDFVATSVPTILGALADWAGAFVGWVLPLVPDLLGALLSLLGDLTKWIVEVGLPKIAGVLAEWGKAFVDWVAPKIQPMLDEAKKLADRLGKWILERAPEVAAQVGLWASAFVNWIKEKVLPVIGPALDKLINGGEGFVGILPWIKAQAEAFPEALGFWVTKFLLWVDEVVKGMPAAMKKITDSIIDWVKSEGAEEFAKAALPLGEAIAKGILTGVLLAPVLISKALLDMIPGVVRGVQKGLGMTPEQMLPAGGMPGASQPLPSDSLTNPLRNRGAIDTSGDISAGMRIVAETAAAKGFDKEDIRLLLSGVVAEGGLTGVPGDGGTSFGALQFHGPGGQLDNFARDMGLSLKDAGEYARTHIAASIEWAIDNYWGKALRAGQAQGLSGANLAGVLQGAGPGAAQVSSYPERAIEAYNNLGGMVDDFLPKATEVDRAITDLQLPIEEYGQHMRRFETDTEVGNQALRDLALTSGHTHGTFLEDAVAMNTGLEATVTAASSFAAQYGISFGEADKIIQNHGQVARAIFGTDIPSSVELTDLAVERFASEFGLRWDEARAILEAGGETAKLVLGTTIPESAQMTIDAVAGVGNNELWRVIDSNAAIAGQSLKTYLEETGAGAANVATASLDDLKKASGLTLPQMQLQAKNAGQDLKKWLQDTGVPAAKELAKRLGVDEGVAGAAAAIKKPVDDATEATKGMGGAMDVAASTQIAAVLLDLRDGLLGLGTHSDGVGLIQGIKDFVTELGKIPADIKVNISTTNGLQAGVAGASPAQLQQTGSGTGSIAGVGNPDTNRSPYPSHIGESGPGGIYNDPTTGKPYTRAGGGPVSAGQLYRVNEAGAHGIELFMPSMNGYVGPKGSGSSGSVAGAGTWGSGLSREDARMLAQELAAVIPNRIAVEDIRSSLIRVGQANGGYVGLA